MLLSNADDKGQVAITCEKGKAVIGVMNADGKLALMAGSKGPANVLVVSHPNGQPGFEVVPTDQTTNVVTRDTQAREIWSAPTTGGK
jgi:hypothetical protein